MRVRATVKFSVAPEEDTALRVLDTINSYMNALRYAVWWAIENGEVRLSRVSKALYRLIKDRFGLTGYLSTTAIKEGIEIAKSWLNNPKRGRKPILRKKHLTLHHRYSYTLDTDSFTASISTIYGRVRVKLLHDKKYVSRFRDWKVKGAKLVLRGDRLYLHVMFEREVIEKNPKDWYGLDVNLREVVLANRSEVKRFRVAFERAFHYFRLANKLQERYPKIWRFNKRILNRIRYFYRRARNIIEHTTSLASTLVVKYLIAKSSSCVMENLKGLKLNCLDKSAYLNAKLNLMAYRKLQAKIEYKLAWHGYKVRYTDPKGTSTTCPKCGSKMKKKRGRLMICLSCGFEANRDVVAGLNLLKKMEGVWFRPDSPADVEMKTRSEAGKLTRGEHLKFNMPLVNRTNPASRS